jgi:hypothetical protein
VRLLLSTCSRQQCRFSTGMVVATGGDDDKKVEITTGRRIDT